MGKTKLARSGSAFPLYLPAWHLAALLLASQPSPILGQDQDPPEAAPSYPPDTFVNPINGDSRSAAATSAALSSALPFETDNANYGSSINNDSISSEHGILNYYFLLLAVVIVIMAVAYWSLARRRRRRINALRNNQQSALARDLETWPGRMRAGRWRHGAAHDACPGEGLDERGEAPPAYVKEPDRAYLEGREGVELRDLESSEGKPPDYESGPVR